MYYLVHPQLSQLTPELLEQAMECLYRQVPPKSRPLKKLSLEEWQKRGFDRNSVFADPMFVDPENCNYQVKPESPARQVGFQNFDMVWGLTDDFPTMWKE